MAGAQPMTPRCKTVVAILGGVAAAVAVVNGAPPAWSALGLPEVATRWHVREEIAKIRTAFEPTRLGMYDIQLDMAKTRRKQIDDRLLSEEIVMEKITDPDERIRKRFQIKKLEEEGKEVDGRIEELRHLRGPEQ